MGDRLLIWNSEDTDIQKTADDRPEKELDNVTHYTAHLLDRENTKLIL